MTALWHCQAPWRECYDFHWLDHLKDPVEKAPEHGYGHRSLAPCHDDRQRSLSTGLGDKGFPVYWCFACKNSNRTRDALINAGIHPGCIKQPRKAQMDLQDQMWAVVREDCGYAEKVLRMTALISGRTRLPRGTELENLAAECGMPRRSAYEIGSRVKGADIVPTPGKNGLSNRQVTRPALPAMRCGIRTFPYFRTSAGSKQVQKLHFRIRRERDQP